MFQAVFFDIGDTLTYMRQSRVERIAHYLTQHGRPVDRAAVQMAKERADAETHAPGLKLPATISDEWEYRRMHAERLLAYLGEASIEAEDFAEATHFLTAITCFPEAHEVLANLVGRVRLGVISNAMPTLDIALDQLDLSKYFEVIINSAVVDAWKPEPRIYQIALEAINLPAAACVFVDNLPENVAAAEALGFTAFLIDREQQFRGSPHRCIDDLWPIVQFVLDQEDANAASVS